MQPDINPEEVRAPDESSQQESHELSDPMLNRVREVARQIEKRVRDAIRDTELDHQLLPENDTTEQPPIQPGHLSQSE